jgi:uncharacterized membrane protein
VLSGRKVNDNFVTTVRALTTARAKVTPFEDREVEARCETESDAARNKIEKTRKAGREKDEREREREREKKDEGTEYEE